MTQHSHTPSRLFVGIGGRVPGRTAKVAGCKKGAGVFMGALAGKSFLNGITSGADCFDAALVFSNVQSLVHQLFVIFSCVADVVYDCQDQEAGGGVLTGSGLKMTMG